VLAEATCDGAGPLTSAAVDVLLQLLLRHRRMQAIEEFCPIGDALLQAPFDGPSLLADIGQAALKEGAAALRMHAAC